MDPRHLTPSASISASPSALRSRLHLPAVLAAGLAALRVLRARLGPSTATVAAR